MMEIIQERLKEACALGKPLRIRAGGSKDWYGEGITGEMLDVSANRGIVSYEPGELVLTAKCGTPLPEIASLLEQHGQMLGFEPPRFSPASTLGGTLACGFSGPRRPYAGAARDFVLGMEILDGNAEHLKFGGQVMKNVAGYDVSRLMVGALGTLGVLLQVSLKVLPKPQAELTLQFECGEEEAIRLTNEWAGRPLPLSATAWLSGMLSVRLSGAQSSVAAAHRKLGGEANPHGEEFWAGLRDHSAAFFRDGAPLWRLSLPATTPPLALSGRQLITWGGAERWLKSDAAATEIRARIAQHGGHATQFSGDKTSGMFQPLPEALMKYQRRLKQQFDPRGILNPGRMYA